MKKEKPITVELARSEYENVQSVELGVPLTALFPRGISFSIDPSGNVEIIDNPSPLTKHYRAGLIADWLKESK